MTELKIELTPVTRLDVINVQQCVRESHGDVLDEYNQVLYCSHHTTGGYIDQGLAKRLNHSLDSIHAFLRTFQKLFPPGKSYQHDNMSLRMELTEEERKMSRPMPIRISALSAPVSKRAYPITTSGVSPFTL